MPPSCWFPQNQYGTLDAVGWGHPPHQFNLQSAILSGGQPAGLTLTALLEGEMPTAWSDQRRLFGDLSDARAPETVASES